MVQAKLGGDQGSKAVTDDRGIAAAKHVLGTRGIPVGPDMRAPMRRLTPAETAALDAAVAEFLAPTAA